MEGLEKERDFYFGKLRDIEVQCQEDENTESSPVISRILGILYATEVGDCLINSQSRIYACGFQDLLCCD